MSVIVYKAKNYRDSKGNPVSLIHKIYPDGMIKTIKTNNRDITTKTYKNYKNSYGYPVSLTKKIYPTGVTVTTSEDDISKTVTTTYKKDGDVYDEECYEDSCQISYSYYKNNELHRDGDKPAYKRIEDNYSTIIKEWFKNGVLHRENGPAVTKDYEQEDVYIREYYLNGEKVSEF
jgi:hypothetical protein